MTKKTALAFTLLFVFAFSFGFAFTLASSAQASGGGCCVVSWCPGHEGTAVSVRGHKVGVLCLYEPPNDCDYTFLCP